MKEAVEVLRDLVSFNTVSSEPPVAAVRYVRSFLEDLGFSCREFGGEQFPNLIARNRAAVEWGRPDAKYYAFCAHIDTVPFDTAVWKKDPFTLEETNGRLYGLGACDMKGPLACMLESLARVSAVSPSLPMALVLTHHEETALEGAREIVGSADALALLRPMQLLIGEPTRLAIGYAHKGVFDFTITVRGRSAHSGSPRHGLNAVYGAATVIERIAALQEEWKSVGGRKFETGNTVNIGTFHAGDVRNRVPALAVATGDMRIVPQSSPARLVEEIRKQFSVLERRGYVCTLEADYEAEPFEMDPGSGFVGDLLRISGAQPMTMSYATDAAVFQGSAGIDCAIIGPGDIRVCHMPGEYIERSQIDAGVETYTRILTNQPVAAVVSAEDMLAPAGEK